MLKLTGKFKSAFPYGNLVETNRGRSRQEFEYELLDTGVFEEDRYWAIDVDYAKADPHDIAMRIRITNVGPDTDTIHVLPHLWLRDTWTFASPDRSRPQLDLAGDVIRAEHWRTGTYLFAANPGPDGQSPRALFCENETNAERIWGAPAKTAYPKDGINDHVTTGSPTVTETVGGSVRLSRFGSRDGRTLGSFCVPS